MKIIKLHESYDIYNDSLEVLDKLPAMAFVVKFAKMRGFYLQEYNIADTNEKIYGQHFKKVEKALKTFKDFDRNLGIILSGKKGIGKSLFAKLLAKESMKNGLPVIIVDEYIPGIASYLAEIEQEAVVMFDEFDKTFGDIKRGDGEQDPQASMLSLFDGFLSGKKMFVITCNEIYKLNDFLINRPGRFHYHFMFNYPSVDEIKEYLHDKLKEEYYPEINKVVMFSRKVNLNYDCLRAIAYELNTGISFNEAITDLNIINMNETSYVTKLVFKNGLPMENEPYQFDIFESGTVHLPRFSYGNSEACIEVSFNPADIIFDPNIGNQIVPAKDLNIEYDFYYLDEDNEKDMKNKEKIKNLIPDFLIIERTRDKQYHYIV